MTQWRDISTAPKDAFILTMSLNDIGEPSNIQRGRYFSVSKTWVLQYGNARTPDPEYWAPLPNFIKEPEDD